MSRAFSNQPDREAAGFIVLALLCDGELRKSELDLLERMQVYERLGMSATEFFAFAESYCEDLRQRSPRDPHDYFLRVDATTLGDLLRSVEGFDRRLEIAALVFEVIRADGRVHIGESLLIWQMLDLWHLRLADVAIGAAMVLPRRRVDLRAPRVFRRSARPSAATQGA